MAAPPLPQPGNDVDVLVPRSARLRGLVREGGPGSLTVALEETELRQPSIPSGSAVEVEWHDPGGLTSVSATVASSRPAPPVLELELAGAPAPVERREHGRAPIALEASAWSLLHPTRRFAGKTVNLGVGGALLRLPGLPPFAGAVQLQVALPDGPLIASARVVRRDEADLVAVAFETVTPGDRRRLVDLVRAETGRRERLDPRRNRPRRRRFRLRVP